MNRLLVVLYVHFILCLLYAGAQDELESFLPPPLIRNSYVFTTKLTTTSTTVKPTITNQNKRRTRGDVEEDSFKSPSSLETDSRPPMDIKKNQTVLSTLKAIYGRPPPPESNNSKEIPHSVFSLKMAPAAAEPPIPPDSTELQNSSDTSGLEDRFTSRILIEKSFSPKSERRKIKLHTGMISAQETENSANFNFISSIIILFEFVIILNII